MFQTVTRTELAEEPLLGVPHCEHTLFTFKLLKVAQQDATAGLTGLFRRGNESCMRNHRIPAIHVIDRKDRHGSQGGGRSLVESGRTSTNAHLLDEPHKAA
jgi:hypothetical protein